MSKKVFSRGILWLIRECPVLDGERTVMLSRQLLTFRLCLFAGEFKLGFPPIWVIAYTPNRQLHTLIGKHQKRKEGA
jgi:hypothetical protein